MASVPTVEPVPRRKHYDLRKWCRIIGAEPGPLANRLADRALVAIKQTVRRGDRFVLPDGSLTPDFDQALFAWADLPEED